jgi:integrase
MRLTRANVATITLPPGKIERLVFDDALPGFGLRVHRGGRRTWFCQFRVGSKQRRLTLGTTETVDAEKARKLAKEALSRAQLGQDPAEAKVEAAAVRKVTMRSVLPSFLAWAEKRQRPDYHADTKRYLERHWAPLLDLPLARIDRARVAARLLEIARERGPVSGNRARAALSRFVTWGIGEGVIHDNFVLGTNLPTPEIARDRVLTDEELRLAWSLAGPGDYGRIVRMLILTAARRDEVASMTWAELTGPTWTIPADRAKNGKALILDLPPAAIAVLGEVEQREGRDLLFGARSGPFSGWSRGKAELDGRLLVALQAVHGPKAALPPWRLHDLRRTAATRMADLGVQPHVVEALLNHISGSRAGVAGIYNRATYRDEKRAALLMWADHVLALVGRH